MSPAMENVALSGELRRDHDGSGDAAGPVLTPRGRQVTFQTLRPFEE
jgi:hypothetical protein